MFNIYLRKFLDIIKELTLGTDAETCIKGLKCGKKEMQEPQATMMEHHKDPGGIKLLERI